VTSISGCGNAIPRWYNTLENSTHVGFMWIVLGHLMFSQIYLHPSNAIPEEHFNYCYIMHPVNIASSDSTHFFIMPN